MLRKRDDELQMKEMVKVKENSQNASWRGRQEGYMMCEFIQNPALCLKAHCVTPAVGRRARNGHLVS